MITRRSFISIVCRFPAALALGPKEVPRFTEEVREELMGTFVQIKAVGAKPGLLRRAFLHMKSLEAVFSRFESTSDLSLLNRDGLLRKPNRILVDLLREVQTAHRETGGSFDPTVLPVLLHLERNRRPLHPDEAKGFRAMIGIEKVVVDDDIVYLKNRKTKLTLDGIAKGAIVDKGVEFLRNNGSSDTLVNAGGDIYCGRKTGGWKAGVYDPLADGLSRTFTLRDMSICTSGSYVNYYTPDKRLHHIIDPRTLACPSDFVSATVTARTTARADMLSTAIFIAGTEGLRFLRDGEKAYLIRRNGQKTVWEGVPATPRGRR